MGEERALAPPEPAKPRLAKSIETARHGDQIFVGRSGSVISPAQRRLLLVATATLTGGSVVAMAAWLASVTHSTVAGVAFVAVPSLVFAWRFRHGRALRRASVFLGAGRVVEARELLRLLDEQSLVPQHRVAVTRLLGSAAWLEGEHAEAAERFADVMRRLQTPDRQGTRGATYWLCAFDRVLVLCAAGELERAREALASLSDAPSGEVFRMLRMAAELAVAFHADDPSRLPGDDELYEWAKAILRTNRFGGSAAILAWVFSRRGDAEMARHMLAEAPSRMEASILARTLPRVHAWALTAKL